MFIVDETDYFSSFCSNAGNAIYSVPPECLDFDALLPIFDKNREVFKTCHNIPKERKVPVTLLPKFRDMEPINSLLNILKNCVAQVIYMMPNSVRILIAIIFYYFITDNY